LHELSIKAKVNDFLLTKKLHELSLKAKVNDFPALLEN
jgi:hypothetical protein